MDLAESLLERLQRLEPSLQAWVTVDREEVLGAARERDSELHPGARSALSTGSPWA